MDPATTYEVARLLLLHWDPVGVGDDDVDPRLGQPSQVGVGDSDLDAVAEYLPEARAILQMLNAGATDEDVAAWFTDYALGLGGFPDHSRDRRTAHAVTTWYRAQHE